MPVYSISNSYLSISVNSNGAELSSLKSNHTELLWQADKAVWPRHAPVLFPIVGKLKGDSYSYNGETYKLTQHGFARDMEFMLTEHNSAVLEFELTANEETLAVFPFHFSFRVRYELMDDSLCVKYFIFNPDKEALLFSVGAHPGFCCKRKDNENLNDFYIEFEGSDNLVCEKLNNGLLSGETYTIPLDSGKLFLNTRLFDQDALVCKNHQVGKVKLGSTAVSTKIELTCSKWPYFGIWSKKGSDAFVCLEPWYGIADGMNSTGNFLNKEGLLRLEQYCKFETEYSIAIRNT